MLQILQGDALAILRTLPENSFRCCVTSPPYWGLRDYGVSGQIGLEQTMGEFIGKLTEVFREVRRVLADDGTCWINMGDGYAGSGKGGNPGDSAHIKQKTNVGSLSVRARIQLTPNHKAKDMLGQPWRLAFALQDDGWYLRSEIIWAKPNPMPESCEDRPTKSHEQIFLLSKSARYFYNTAAAREPVNGNAHARGNGLNPKSITVPAGWNTGPGAHKIVAWNTPGKNSRIYQDRDPAHPSARKAPRSKQNESFSGALNELVHDRNWRDVWTFATEGYDGAHFATFPSELAKRCILAGSKHGDHILDPFGGSGTTGQVALSLGRKATLIELNPDYIAMCRQRCETTIGLAL